MEFKIGVTVFDEWDLLWGTHIGQANGNCDLLFTAWGKTESESKEAAISLLLLICPQKSVS